MADAAELMNRLAAALEGHDVDALAACWHPDVETTHVLRPDRSWQGRDFYRETMARHVDSGSRGGVEVTDRGVGANGDRFFLETLTTHPDGTAVPCLCIYILQDDMVRWARVYTDKVQRDGHTMADWNAEHNA